MNKGKIATLRQAADEFRRERHGIEYAHPDGVVGQLLRSRKVKLKTGRPRHEKADPEEQEEAFKKTSWTPSGEAGRAIAGSR